MDNNTHQDLYTFFSDLSKKFHPRDYLWDYKNAEPLPFIVLDNFLPDDIFRTVVEEYKNIPQHLWTEFTRNGSLMRECKNWSYTPVLNTLSGCFNSGVFLDWLEAVTGHKKIISDPHYIGAGISVTGTGSCLRLHTDFNWNDELALNRCLSLILYINPEWDESWGGQLDFYDFDYEKKRQSIAPLPNRLIIWDYDERLLHGYPDPLRSPADHPRVTLRIFYYQSNSTPVSPPHRSLYWWDEETKKTFDDRTQK